MNLSRFFLLSYLSICIPLMATNPNSEPDQQPSFKDRVADTVSQGTAYVSPVIIGNPNTSAVNVSGIIPEDKIIHLIFMGKTGAGKSTFINTFYNLALGTKWDDFTKKFPIGTKFQHCNVEEYQTSPIEQPIEYLVKGKNFIIKLIDSPGLINTRGIDQDMLNTDEIAKFVAKAGGFNAICIVLSGSVNRATAEEKYLIEQLKTLIPMSAYKRIFILVSRASSPSSDVEAYVKYFSLPTENIFYFDNFALTKEGYIDVKNINLTEEATNPDETENDFFSENIKDSEIALKIKDSWTKAQKEFGKVIRKAHSLGKHSADEMERISKIKSLITEKMFEAHRCTEALESTEIKVKTAEAQKKATEALDPYETYTVIEPYNTSYCNTICMNCGVNCHNQCGCVDYKGAEYVDHLSGCACITNGSCNVCPNKCSYTYHRHRYQAYRNVSKKRDNKIVIQQKLNAEKQFNEQKEKLNILNIQKNALQNEIVQLHIELGQVSMSSINFYIDEYYDTLIRQEEDLAKKAKLNRDRKLYIELVNLYEQKQKLLDRRE